MSNIASGALVYNYEGELCVVEKECSCKCCVMLINLNKNYSEQRAKDFCRSIDEEKIMLDLNSIDEEINNLNNHKEKFVKAALDFIEENINGFGIGEKKFTFQKGDVCLGSGNKIYVVEDDNLCDLKFAKCLESPIKQQRTSVGFMKKMLTVEEFESRLEKSIGAFDEKIKLLENKKETILKILDIV